MHFINRPAAAGWSQRTEKMQHYLNKLPRDTNTLSSLIRGRKRLTAAGERDKGDLPWSLLQVGEKETMRKRREGDLPWCGM